MHLIIGALKIKFTCSWFWSI